MWYKVSTVDRERAHFTEDLGDVTTWAVEADSENEAKARLWGLHDQNLLIQVPHNTISVYKLNPDDFINPGLPTNPDIDLTLSKD